MINKYLETRYILHLPSFCQRCLGGSYFPTLICIQSVLRIYIWNYATCSHYSFHVVCQDLIVNIFILSKIKDLHFDIYKCFFFWGGRGLDGEG